MGSRRGVRSIAAAVLLSAPVTAHAEEALWRWAPVSTSSIGAPVLAGGGRIAHLGRDHEVHLGPATTATTGAGWSRLPFPVDFDAHALLVDDSGRVVLAGRREGRTADTVLLREPGSSSWREEVPGAHWSINSLSSAGGDLFAGGSRREILRRHAGRWSREATSRPYHNEDLRMNDDATGWAWSTTRQLLSVEFRTPRGWISRFEDASGTCGLLLATRDEAWVRTGAGVVRVAAPDRAAGSAPDGLPPCGGALVALSDPEHGWILDVRGLHRWIRGEVTTLLPPPAFRPSSLFDLGDAGLFVREDGGGLWRLEKGSGEAQGALALPGFERVRHAGNGPVGRFFGTAVLRLEGRLYLYVVHHEDRNPTMALTFDQPEVIGTVPHWAELSDRLRTAGDRMSADWGYTYDTGALAGDLDGDGLEDLLVTNMYTGVQVMRNVRDDHFVDWTKDAGFGPVDPGQTAGACLLDVEGDGDLDLYVADLLRSDALYLNEGGAVFRRAGPEAGIATKDGSSMPLCADLDGDGDVDVAVPTFGRGVALHENVGVGGEAAFRTRIVLAESSEAGDGAALSVRNLSSLAAADLDGDGLPELFVAAATGCDLLLANRGGGAFVPAEGVLPADQPCLGSVGADFLDSDGDGDLDLAVTGHGGSRIYRNDRGIFVWERAVVVPPEAAARYPKTTGSAVVDFDDDGDPDLVHAADGWPLTFHRNLSGGERAVTLRVRGPHANTGAVGAAVELRRAASPAGTGARLATRWVPGGSGYGSHADKRVHFAVTPGERYDLVVRLAGAEPGIVPSVAAPFAGEVALEPLSRDGPVARARSFLADRWHRGFVFGTLLATLLTVVGAVLLHRPARLLPIAVPFVSFGLFVALPLDPGATEAIVPPVAAAGVAIASLLGLRLARRPAAEPEVLWELAVALRTFGHNEEPRRVVDNLRFVLANAGEGFPPGSEKAALLDEDLRNFRNVALPELETIVRLAERTPCADARLVRAVERLRSLRPAAREVAEALGIAADAVRAMRSRLDRLLSVPFRRCVELWLASRRPLAGLPLEAVLPDGPDVMVRALPAEIDRMLDVLLDNAREAMKGSSGRVRLEADWDGDGWARLRFRDSGPGVPADLAPRIFEPGVSGRGGGGFGLHYVKRTVQRCGGRVALEPSAAGACFLLELEIVRGEAA